LLNRFTLCARYALIKAALDQAEFNLVDKILGKTSNVGDLGIDSQQMVDRNG